MTLSSVCVCVCAKIPCPSSQKHSPSSSSFYRIPDRPLRARWRHSRSTAPQWRAARLPTRARNSGRLVRSGGRWGRWGRWRRCWGLWRSRRRAWSSWTCWGNCWPGWKCRVGPGRGGRRKQQFGRWVIAPRPRALFYAGHNLLRPLRHMNTITVHSTIRVFLI